VPDIGDAPAVRDLGASTLGTMIASSMNTALLSTIGSDTEVKLFDAFGLLDDVCGGSGFLDSGMSYRRILVTA
jgi:hypothetical protein